MKTSIKYLSGCLTACMLLLAGCVELDVVPTNRYTDANYWTSPEKASSMLSMAYRQMNDAGRIFRDERLSDNLYNSYGNDAVRVTANGQATSSTEMFDNVWGDMYAGIKTTHTFLANVDRVEGMDEALRTRMKAEARFLRAFMYFQLTNWYGDVPFFTEDITLAIASTISPTPQATIVEWIHSELEEVAEILPTREEYADADRGRITAGAAAAFNARVALNFNDWERVKTYTEKLMSNEYGTYSLFPNYQELFFYANQYNSEIILDIQYATDQRTWSEISTYVPFGLSEVQYVQASPTQDLVDTYLMLDGSKWEEGKDPYADRDPRLDMTIVHHGSTITHKEDPSKSYTVNVDPNDTNNDTKDKIGRENGTRTGYFYRKFYDPNPAAWTGGKSWNCNINFVVLRWADVLLMHAEAMNGLNQMDAAVWDKTIKPSRQRAGFSAATALDFPGGDQAALEPIIRDERRVELALEGTRIYDIRRWRIAEIVMNAARRGAKFDLSSGSLDYYEYRNNSFNRNRDYLWAIPRQQWTINQNLGQNDGY
jgi:starch-binding outer membrane protein, SusD/RagB family